MSAVATFDQPEHHAGAARHADFHREQLFWRSLAEAAPARQPGPLLDESARLVDDWLVHWHRGSAAETAAPAVGCFVAGDVTVAERGMIFFDGRLVTAPSLLPSYIRHAMQPEAGGSDAFRRAVDLPLRTIEEPCIVFYGHGLRVYGHFLLDALPRLMVALRGAEQLGLAPQILLDRRTAGWARRILREHLGIGEDRIVEHQADIERVLLRRAILPTFAYTDRGLHPFAETLFEDLEEGLGLEHYRTDADRIFLSRFLHEGSASVERHCANEAELLRIAAREYGFTPIFPETLSWRMQISLLRNAKAIAGPFGSGLHNAIFAGPDTRIGAVGWLNLAQSHLSAFRGHRMAYLRTVPPTATATEYAVDHDDFRAFLDALTR